MAAAEAVDCVVVGAGVVGLAVAAELAQRGREVLLLEALETFGTVTSSRNSEVIHAGVYYPEGSLKARLCVAGKALLYAYLAERGIDHEPCGKLIVAADESEIAGLKAVQAKAAAAGVELPLISGAEARAREPDLACVAALHSPTTGILDSHGLMLSLLGDLEAAGGLFVAHAPVVGGAVGAAGITLEVGGAEPMTLQARSVVNCAGHGAQTLTRALSGAPGAPIPPQHSAKGRYFSLLGRAPFSHLIYPLPQAASLGLHYTRDLGGQGRFGPDVEWIEPRADGSFDYTVPAEDAAGFAEAIRRYWPGLPDNALSPAYAGVRPKIQAPGEPAADFALQDPKTTGVNGYVALYGIESPGLTACLAIARTVAEMRLLG
ncbi:NAD(P)/FAD-dependent oxidoreductase [Roseospirillum parvum]|uniref:L-2-hydroxyglutarate oxidase LhgO n=1 Tax=Roseospirillum parvum TaxID=83401 RepID=A0A1G7ZJL1_9PROT|nr:NAD(P)/FAD-dependent oxidoreductase [Roseospirillum parvum]SDH08290.1 L-2-hydroxyglutarate oxidase LhgO [Roseospirillum parvum]